jgi:hypothetical protein
VWTEFTCINFFNSHSGGWSPNGSTRHVGHWMAYCTCPGWLWWWRFWWNKARQGKPKYSEETYLSATLSTTNTIWPDPGANPGRRGGRPATNRLSYGAARIHLQILKGSDDGVQHTGLLFFFTFPSSGILETRKHDISENGSVSVLWCLITIFIVYFRVISRRISLVSSD